ncbi:hypothetical protein [Desertivirga brevis]|uniref:hypothetical protein n=1 Tax=Desertivirga brevis TaxID=2810310 RepID=UPI001A95EB75|nr:hypothetical protein [Pedobacter sp. SYSU D00873]
MKKKCLIITLLVIEFLNSYSQTAELKPFTTKGSKLIVEELVDLHNPIVTKKCIFSAFLKSFEPNDEHDFRLVDKEAGKILLATTMHNTPVRKDDLFVIDLITDFKAQSGMYKLTVLVDNARIITSKLPDSAHVKTIVKIDLARINNDFFYDKKITKYKRELAAQYLIEANEIIYRFIGYIKTEVNRRALVTLEL